jgi:hypothetical protein
VECDPWFPDSAAASSSSMLRVRELLVSCLAKKAAQASRAASCTMECRSDPTTAWEALDEEGRPVQPGTHTHAHTVRLCRVSMCSPAHAVQVHCQYVHCELWVVGAQGGEEMVDSAEVMVHCAVCDPWGTVRCVTRGAGSSRPAAKVRR